MSVVVILVNQLTINKIDKNTLKERLKKILEKFDYWRVLPRQVADQIYEKLAGAAIVSLSNQLTAYPFVLI
ncbi:MAG: hypothetical protein JWR50_1445 [Mucilaginibacter sp.]|nr:hypothetical protein [Mucilaginibacter sp.]